MLFIVNLMRFTKYFPKAFVTTRLKCVGFAVLLPLLRHTSYMFLSHTECSHLMEFIMRYLAFEKFVGVTALALGLIMLAGIYV